MLKVEFDFVIVVVGGSGASKRALSHSLRRFCQTCLFHHELDHWFSLLRILQQ
jgi:hypothetical protein